MGTLPPKLDYKAPLADGFKLLGYTLENGQLESRPADLPGTRLVNAVKSFVDMIYTLRRNADAGICHLHRKVLMVCIQLDPHPAVLLVVLDRIFHQIGDDLRYLHEKERRSRSGYRLSTFRYNRKEKSSNAYEMEIESRGGCMSAAPVVAVRQHLPLHGKRNKTDLRYLRYRPHDRRPCQYLFGNIHRLVRR